MARDLRGHEWLTEEQNLQIDAALAAWRGPLARLRPFHLVHNDANRHNVMVTPDGNRRFWDPHGLISECMRSSDDQRQSWLEFLRSDQRALNAWCQQRAYEAVRTNAALTAYVSEIDGLLASPCR